MHRTAEPAREAHAERKADREVEDRLDERDRHQAAELAEQQDDSAHRRQREPVEKSGLDVARELDVRVDRREQRALHERHGEREREERVRREARKPRRRLEAAGVHGEEQHRKDRAGR